MTSLDSPNRELRDLGAYAELALYYAVMRRDPHLSPADLADLVIVLRDLLGDIAPSAAADREVARAYDAARERAARLGIDTSFWKSPCPWHLQDLVETLSALAEELGTPASPTLARREFMRDRKSFARGGALGQRPAASRRRARVR
jgi:hypothetical protein